MFQYCWKTPEK